MKSVKSEYEPFQPSSKQIWALQAENILKPNLNQTFSSIGELAAHLKCDRSTIRSHIEGKSQGLYRKQ